MSEQDDRPWSRFVTRRATGDVVEGLVTRALPFGTLVEIDGVSGLVPGPGPAEPGSRIPVRVTTIDVARRRFAAERA